MSEPTVPVAEVGVPLTFNDEPKGEIDCIDERTTEDLQREFESGMLDDSDFEQTQRKPEDYAEDEAVPVFPDELPTELDSDAPQVELLLNEEQAVRLLDSLAPSWRRWGEPPLLRASGRGWYATGFSEHDLRAWVAMRRNE